MKAWVVEEPGPGAVFQERSWPIPVPVRGEVLVRIQAAGMNPIDAKTKLGRGFTDRLPSPPWVLGWDLAGEVVALGPEVSRFRVGDPVLGLVRFPEQGGCYAEYAAVPEADLALRPPSLGIYEAAGLPLAGLTAWQTWADPALAALATAGQPVLVVGAAGGVGHLLVGLGVLRGAQVWGVGSLRNRELILELGARGYLAYDAPSSPPTFSGLVDAVGDPTLDQWAMHVTDQSRVIRLVGGRSTPEVTARLAVDHLLVHPDGQALSSLAELVASRHLTLRLAGVYPMEKINEAHEQLALGRSTGKLVLAIAR